MQRRRVARIVNITVAWLVLMCGPALHQTAAEPGYEDYTSWENWARLQVGARTRLAASYDRSGLNADYSQYESPSGLITDEVVCTVKTIQGPGLIYRFFMPHLTSNRSFVLRMFFDGEAVPRIDTTSDVILGGAFNYFAAPLVNTCAGAQVCYEPIPFAESLRIETVNHVLPDTGWSADRHYYQYTYKLLPRQNVLASYTGALTPAQQAARAAMVDLFDNAGEHPAGSSTTSVNVTTSGVVVPAGACRDVANLSGPGLIRRLNIRMDAADDDELDGLRLRVTYAEEAQPAIDVSLADFFGAGHQRAAFKSIPLGTDSPGGFYCYWPMPFRESVLVELCNTTGMPISISTAGVEYEPGPVTADMGYLHALAITDVKAPGQIYHPMLSTAGRGHYVGSLLYLEQDSYSFSMLEGDDIITVDGTDTLYGTGLEDTYNGGYYYNWVGVQSGEPEGSMPQSATRPLYGILYVHREAGVEHARADQYRWFIGDRVGFSTSIDVKIENRYAITGARWTSVAFWYQQPAIRGDAESDGDLDLRDFARFQSCYRDEGPACLSLYDYDDDTDVDSSDFDTFIASFSGPL